MTGNKEAQAASRDADRRLRAAHPDEHAEYMVEEYAKRDLTWNPRLTAEERATKKAAEEKAAVVAKIKALAEKGGVGVLLVDDPDIEAKIESAKDGTFKGVSFDWHGDANGFADEAEPVAAE